MELAATQKSEKKMSVVVVVPFLIKIPNTMSIVVLQRVFNVYQVPLSLSR
jgi:hypothetical protein